MSAILIYADGRTEELAAFGHFVSHKGRWFRMAGVAVDQNTTYDGGQQFTYADGPPNDGRAVYIEVKEPCFAGARVTAC